MLEFTLLGYLMYADMTGYDLKQRIQESLPARFDASFGGIYPALKRMTAKGLISFQEVVNGGKYKKVYSLTENGKAHFMNTLDQPLKYNDADSSPYIMPIFFFDFLPKENAIEKLKGFIEEVKEYRTRVKSKEPEAKQICGVCQFTTLILALDYYDLLINWCNNLIKELENN